MGRAGGWATGCCVAAGATGAARRPRARLRRHALPSIEDLIESGSIVSTDGHAGYNGVADAGYTHDRHSLYATGDPAHVAMPRVHRGASLLKRWLLGTHQGAVRPQQLDYYLDEYSFRFNRRGSNYRGLSLLPAPRTGHADGAEAAGGHHRRRLIAREFAANAAKDTEADSPLRQMPPEAQPVAASKVEVSVRSVVLLGGSTTAIVTCFTGVPTEPEHDGGVAASTHPQPTIVVTL